MGEQLPAKRGFPFPPRVAVAWRAIDRRRGRRREFVCFGPDSEVKFECCSVSSSLYETHMFGRPCICSIKAQLAYGCLRVALTWALIPALALAGTPLSAWRCAGCAVDEGEAQ